MFGKLSIILMLIGSAYPEPWSNTTMYMDSVLACFQPVARADTDELVIPTLETVHFVVNSNDGGFVQVNVAVHNKTKISGIEGLRRKINCSDPIWSSAQEDFNAIPPWFDGRDVFECILNLPILHIRYEGSVKVGNAQPIDIRVSVKGKHVDFRTTIGTVVEPNTENVGIWLSGIFAERKVSVIADGDELSEQLTNRLKEFFLDFANRNKYYYPLLERVIWRGFDQCIRKKPLVPANEL